MYFQKEVIKIMFKDDKICDYLFNNLIEYNSFFGNLILSKDDVIKLLGKANNYNQILKLLFYLSKDFSLILEFIIDAKDTILKLFNEESIKIEEENKNFKNKDEKKEIQLIDIEKYVEPKEEDNIPIIYEKINQLEQLNLNKVIKISPSLIVYRNL